MRNPTSITTPKDAKLLSSSMTRAVFQWQQMGLFTVSLLLLPTANDGLISTQPPPSKQKQPQRQERATVTLVPPPGPFKWPIVGTLPDFFARGGVDGMCEVHESMYKDYGTVYGMSLAGDEELVVCDPRTFDEVLRKEGRFPVGAAEGVPTFTDYYKENDLKLAMKSSSRGPGWKEWRTSMNPDMVVMWETYLPSIADAAAKASAVAGSEVNKDGGRGNIDFEQFISRLAFDMFSAVLFGENPRTVDSSTAERDDVEFVKNTQKAFDATGALMSDPLAKMFGSDLYLDFVKSMDITFAFATRRTKTFAEKARREQRQHNEDDTATDRSGKCPIQGIKSTATDLLTNGKRNLSFVERLVGRNELSDNDISEVTPLLLMAGVDTTAYVMSWLYLNLASNPDAQEKLATELYDVLGGSDVTTAAQMESLPYLKACLRESHRLTPTAPISVKTLECDINIDVGDGTGRKCRVKAGRRISLNLRAFPMDPKYVKDPTKYTPERFLPEAIAKRRGTVSEIMDHPYFEDPFGRGKRKCLGGNVAHAEIMSATARLVQDWKISFPSSDNGVVERPQWKPKQKLMLKADPYPKLEMIPRTINL